MSLDLVVYHGEKYSVLQDPDSSFTVNLRKVGLIKRSETLYFVLTQYQTLFDNKQWKDSSNWLSQEKTRDKK